MVKGEGHTMVRRWMHVLLTVAVVAGLGGLAGCHEKEPAKVEGTAVERTSTQEEPAAAGPAAESGVEAPAEEPAGPPPTPASKGPVAYPAGEGPVLIAGAHIGEKVREPGHWHLSYTVDVAPQRVLSFYRQEAGKRGWTERSFQAMGPGGFITWETTHGELQLIAGRSPAGGSSVDLNWNQAQ